MNGLMLVPVLVLALVCVYKQIKLNMDELREDELRARLERQKYENKLLEAKLNNIEVNLDIKTIGF